MKIKISKVLLSALLFVALVFSFTGCEEIMSLLGPNEQETNQELTIEKSGLAVNKYVNGVIDSDECTITLFAKTGQFYAEKTSRAAAVRATDSGNNSNSYEGYFVYNSTKKILYMRVSARSLKYYKANIDLAGTKGSNSEQPESIVFNSSSKTEFTNSIEEVKDLPAVGEPYTKPDDNNGDNNNGENNNGESGNNGGENTNPDDNTTITAPYAKTKSTYTSGRRNINISDKKSGTGVVFKSTIQPAAKTDYSAIDNAVKNLSIPTTMSISDAAKQIVNASGAKTQKEKVRALFTWMANNIEYEYYSSDKSKYTAEGAFKNRSAVCGGFSYLMVDMCKAIDITAIYVTGCGSKADYTTPEQQKDASFFISNHAWNLIKTDAGNFLLDVTWASSYLHYDAPALKAMKDIWDIWFDTDPCYFITSHYPIVEKHYTYTAEEVQLLTPPITKEEFITLPILQPYLEYFGLDGKELLEFVATHLDSWGSTHKVESFKNGNVNIYTIPMSYTLLNGTEYEVLYEKNGTFTKQIIPSNGYVPISDVVNCFYNFENSFSTVRSTPKEWFAVETGDASIINENAKKNSSINEKGEITINGSKISMTGFVPVVKQGTYAKVDGNLPVGPKPYMDVELGQTHYDYVIDDSAFPIGRKVKFDSFEMAKYPVTIELYKKVMDCVTNFGGLKEPTFRRQMLLLDNPDNSAWTKEGDIPIKGKTFLICSYKPVYASDDAYWHDYATGLSYLDAALFCNALTKLLMSEDDCVYRITDAEWDEGPQPFGIADNVTEEQVEMMRRVLSNRPLTNYEYYYNTYDQLKTLDGIDLSKLTFPKENILSMHIATEKNIDKDYLAPIQHEQAQRMFFKAYVSVDLSKKGFRLPTDAEWEYAARGADPSADCWKVEHTMNEAYGKENSIGLVDLFVKNWLGPWQGGEYSPYYDTEMVEDWLVSNTEYSQYRAEGLEIGYVDDEGYIWDPLLDGGICRSRREGTSARSQNSKTHQESHLNRLRLVRNLD